MADQETLQLLLTKMAIDVADLKKGLQDGRNDLQGFKTMAQGVGASVKKALAFTGIAVGIYEIASALKSFAKEAALTGARTETLAISARKIGETYGVSAESIKYFVEQAKTAGITTQESLQGVSKFLTSGLPLEQLKDLATRARDIAVVAGVNTSEAFNRIIQGIITGEQETLRRMMIQVGHTDDIYKRYAATLGKTKEELNSVEKAQAMLNEVMRLSAGFAGVAAEADQSVGKQIASMARFAEEAKNSLWALFGPVMLAGVQQLTKGWQELKTWSDANQESLRDWGESAADFLKQIVNLAAAIGKYLIEHKDLVVALVEFKLFSIAAGWVLALGTAATTAAVGLRALAIGATAVNAAMLPWLVTLKGLVVALAAYGAYQTIKKPASLDQMSPEEAALLGPALVLAPPKKSIDEFEGYEKPMPPGVLGYISPAEREAKAKRDALAALEKAKANAPKPTGKDGKGGKDDNLLAPTMAMYKSLREVELQAAQNSLDLLKSTNEAKRAELEKALAEGIIDGTTYYQSLQDLQRTETTAALAMIEQKRQAQQKAHQESIAELEADEKLSPEAKNIAMRKLEAEQRKALAKLDVEAAQVRLQDEVKITNELRRQVDVRKQFQEKTEDLNLETSKLLGAISEQEATLQRLYLDWQRAKAEAIKAGASPEYLQALEKNFQAKSFNTTYGELTQGISTQVAQGFSGLTNEVIDGTIKLQGAYGNLFKGLIKSILEPGFKQLQQWLQDAFLWLFKSIQNSLETEGQTGDLLSWLFGGGGGGGGGGSGDLLSWLFGGGGGGIAQAAASMGAWEKGGAFYKGLPIKSFAYGAIFDRPTMFRTGGALAQLGENGPETIMPLTRGPDGKLGVQAAGDGEVHHHHNNPTYAITIHAPNGLDVKRFFEDNIEVLANLFEEYNRDFRGRGHS